MARLAIKQTTRGKTTLTETPVSGFIPYSHHIDDHTIVTKDGYFLQVIRVDGFSFETADQTELNYRKHVRNTLWRGLGNSRFAVYHHIIRREVTMYPDSDFEDFCEALDNEWRAKLDEKRLFINEQFITVVRRPLRGSVGILTEAMRIISSKADKQAAEADRKANLKALYEATSNIVGTLQSYGARLMTTYETPGGVMSEALEFLSYLINHDARPVRLPRMNLADYLAYKRPFFGAETIEIRGAEKENQHFAAIIAIKEYGPESAAGMIDGLLRLPHELVLSQSFGFIDRQKALDGLNKVQRQMDVADDAAVSLKNQLVEAADDTASGRIAWGEHHLSVLVKARTGDDLDRAVTDVLAELTNLGLIAVREDINMEPSFWAQLPGNFSFIARNAPISSANFAGYASLHNFPIGKFENNHWGPCVCMLETTSATPYSFNFHHGDLGNFTVIGPSGTGKTVVLTFLMAQAQRFKPRAVFFDKDRGAEIFIRAMGGSYSLIRPGRKTGFNPLQLPDTPSNRSFLRDWLGQLLKPLDGTTLSASDRGIIADAIEANFDQESKYRRLAHLQELFEGHDRPSKDSLSARLAPWHSAGERAWLFDNEQDDLTLDNRTTGFDLTYILDDETGRPPALMYLFHRVDLMLTGEKTIIFIDEGWKGLKDADVANRIEDWERTIRKRNGVFGLGSQSAKSIVKSSIGDVIIEQSPTQIFMPNLKADQESYCEGFGLSLEEFRIVKELPDNSRCFLVKHGADSVIARLDLAGLDDTLAVLSGREETVGLLDQIRAEVGDDPADWLPLFHQRRKL